MFIGKLSMPRQAEWNTPRNATQKRFFFFELACLSEIEPPTVAPMKSSTKISTVAGAHLLSVAFIVADTPEQEKSLCRQVQSSNEGKNIATLESFLYTRLRPRGLEFYKMMQSGEASRKFPTLTLLISRRRTLKKRRHRWTDQPAKFA